MKNTHTVHTCNHALTTETAHSPHLLSGPGYLTGFCCYVLFFYMLFLSFRVLLLVNLVVVFFYSFLLTKDPRAAVLAIPWETLPCFLVL